MRKVKPMDEKSLLTPKLFERIDKQITQARIKAKEYEKEKEKEVASYVKKNEQITNILKTIFEKSSVISSTGSVYKIELFEECISILRRQTENVMIKKELQENPFEDLLKVATEIWVELYEIKTEYSNSIRPDSFYSATEKRIAEENLINTTNKYSIYLKYFRNYTFEGSVIMTEKLFGKGIQTGKPTGF